MNMGSKGKQRMVLPSRPDLPSIEKIIEDINRADPTDPLFKLLHTSNKELNGESQSGEVEARYMQSRHYLELNEKLQEARTDLIQRREALVLVGESLEQSVEKVKHRAV